MADKEKKRDGDDDEKKYYYKQVNYWLQMYGNSGIPDQRAVETYIDCETSEAVQSLRNELIGISRGNYQDAPFDVSVGVKRRVRHGTYQEWARLMLLWMANYKH
jgi:hypothetical protein